MNQSISLKSEKGDAKLLYFSWLSNLFGPVETSQITPPRAVLRHESLSFPGIMGKIVRWFFLYLNPLLHLSCPILRRANASSSKRRQALSFQDGLAVKISFQRGAALRHSVRERPFYKVVSGIITYPAFAHKYRLDGVRSCFLNIVAHVTVRLEESPE